MPGKHVHFSPLTGSFGTPSPSFSNSTLPSSPGAITPPSLGFGSPYQTKPLPGLAASLHAALVAGSNPKVEYNLSCPPDTLKPLAPIFSGFFDQSATQPEVPFMDISCPQLPWRITVTPRSQKLGYVTIGDVFAALYRSLRTNVTKEEFDVTPSEELKKMIDAAYRFRYKSQPSAALYEAEKAKGLKRVDFLGTQTRFMGLVPAKGAEAWILLVS